MNCPKCNKTLSRDVDKKYVNRFRMCWDCFLRDPEVKRRLIGISDIVRDILHKRR
jgi:hypothetical protein